MKPLSLWQRLNLPCAVMMIALLLSQGLAYGQDAEQRPQSYEALADLLEDEEKREVLINELRRLSAEETVEPAEAKPVVQRDAVPDAAPQPAVQPSLPRRIAEYTEALAQGIGARVSAAMSTLNFADDESSGPAFDGRAFLAAATSLALVVGATIAVYLLLRAGAAPLFTRAGKWVEAGDTDFIRRALAIGFSFLLDVVVILLSVAVGYAIALFGFGEAGDIGTREALFINAFAMVEIFKAIVRMVFAARYENLRPFPMSEKTAAWWSMRLNWLAGTIGYALLVVVPIINVQLSRNIGAIVSLLIMTLAYIYALRLILGNRKVISERIQDLARSTSTTFFDVLLRILSKLWHVIALIYFTVLFLVSQLEPDEALPYMMGATAQTLLAVGVGLALSVALTVVIGRRLQIPERLRARMPMLEERINAFVPATLKTLRVAILVVVTVLVLNAWAVFDLGAWVSSGAGLAAMTMIVRVGIVLLVAMLVWTVAASVLEARMGSDSATSRQVTLLALFQNTLAIAVWTITAMVVLSQIGVDIGPLIAGAGVLGLAIGFGAQKMVSDVITGIFIQIDNAMNVGDIVSAGGISGTVEKLSIRSVVIRDLSGTYHVIRFSSVDVVSNYMRDFAFHVGEYGISYREDIDHAVEHLRAAFEELKEDPTHGANIIDEINVAGVTALADSSVNIRAMIKTKPGSQWAVGRAYNRLVKIHFDRAGIEIPFPHTTLYFGEDRNGNAPAAHLRLQDERAIKGA